MREHGTGAAQGMIMERFGLTLDQSFAVLRRISWDENVKLAEIARQLVQTGTLPAAE